VLPHVPLLQVPVQSTGRPAKHAVPSATGNSSQPAVSSSSSRSVFACPIIGAWHSAVRTSDRGVPSATRNTHRRVQTDSRWRPAEHCRNHPQMVCHCDTVTLAVCHQPGGAAGPTSHTPSIYLQVLQHPQLIPACVHEPRYSCHSMS
jgi:hypothetical protein